MNMIELETFITDSFQKTKQVIRTSTATIYSD